MMIRAGAQPAEDPKERTDQIMPGALITGASKGLGQEIAYSLGNAGCGVAVGYHTDENGAHKTVATLAKNHIQAMPVRIDVTDPQSIHRAAAAAEATIGPITILVNNAGAITREGFDEITLEHWDHVLNVCLRGAFLCSQAIGPRIKAAAGGAIINIASTAAFHPEPRSHHYVAAKSGLLGLTKALALSLAPSVSVNCVAPGYMTSPEHNESRQDFRESILSRLPLRRTADASEVAELVSFLALRGRYITGQTIIIDGGLSIK